MKAHGKRRARGATDYAAILERVGIIGGSFCPLDWSTGAPKPEMGDEGPVVELCGDDVDDLYPDILG